MGGFAFLAMLGTYALVLYWYALNHERDEDGRDGLLGIRSHDLDQIPQKRLKDGHSLIRRRGELPHQGKAATALEVVRAKAARIAKNDPRRR